MKKKQLIFNRRYDKENVKCAYADLRNQALEKPYLGTGDKPFFIAIWEYNSICKLYSGIIIRFIDNEKYGSFYPHWCVESSFRTGKTGINLKLASQKMTDDIWLAQQLALSDAGIQKDKIHQKLDDQLGYKVPLTEDEILKLPLGFKELIRRK